MNEKSLSVSPAVNWLCPVSTLPHARSRAVSNTTFSPKKDSEYVSLHSAVFGLYKSGVILLVLAVTMNETN